MNTHVHHIKKLLLMKCLDLQQGGLIKIYLRLLSIIYLMAAALHWLDLLDLRLHFSEMNTIWKTWIIYLAVADSIVSVGLWKNKQYGEVSFLIVTTTQLIAFGLFQNVFGTQNFLITFHLLTMSIYIWLKYSSIVIHNYGQNKTIQPPNK